MDTSTNNISARSFFVPDALAYKASHLLCYLARGEEGLVSQNACHNSLKRTCNRFEEFKALLDEDSKGTLLVAPDTFAQLIEFLIDNSSGIVNELAKEIVEIYDVLDLEAIVEDDAAEKAGPVIVHEKTTSITVDAADMEFITLPTFADGEIHQYKQLKATKVQVDGKETYLYDGIGAYGIIYGQEDRASAQAKFYEKDVKTFTVFERGEGRHGIPFITLETFFELVLQAQSAKARMFKKEALRVVLAVMSGQEEVVNDLMKKFDGLVGPLVKQGTTVKQIVQCFENGASTSATAIPMFTYMGESMPFKDLTSIVLVIEFAMKIAAKKKIHDLKYITVNGVVKYHLPSLMVVFGDYDGIKAAQKRLEWKQADFLGLLSDKTITTGKYKNSNEGKFISFKDFKLHFINEEICEGTFAGAIKNVVMHLGESAQAGDRRTIEETLEHQDNAMKQSTNPVAKAMALEHKRNVEVSSSKTLGIERPISLLEAEDFSPFEILGANETRTLIHPSVKVKELGVYFLLTDLIYDDKRIVKIGSTNRGEQRIIEHVAGEKLGNFMVIGFIESSRYQQLEKGISVAFKHLKKVPNQNGHREKYQREQFILDNGIETLKTIYQYGMEKAMSLSSRPNSPMKKKDHDSNHRHDLAMKRIEAKKEVEMFKIEKEMDLTKELMKDMSIEEKTSFWKVVIKK